MIKTGFNEKRFNDVTEEIDFICDPTPPEVQEWTQTQLVMANIERRKKLTDNDIRNSLILQFKKLNTYESIYQSIIVVAAMAFIPWLMYWNLIGFNY